MTTTTSSNGTGGARMKAEGAPGTRERRADGFLHSMIDVGGVRLHVAEARPAGLTADAVVPDDVPLVVLLHGFPEFWWSWRHQLASLAAAGYWVVAPDMRGYNESDKPEGIESYELEDLAGDVAGLVRALGRKDAVVVGHDWGAMVAWATAMMHPEVVRRLAICNVPHPLEMQRGLRRPAQLKKSWYMFFFQLPGIPEKTIAKDDFAYLRRTFSADGFPAEEIEPYVDAMRVPGAVTSAVNYYRAAIRRIFKANVPPTKVIECPVLVLWGEKDRFLGKEMATPPARFVPDAKVVFFPNATHWVQHDEAEAVGKLLADFVKG